MINLVEQTERPRVGGSFSNLRSSFDAGFNILSRLFSPTNLVGQRVRNGVFERVIRVSPCTLDCEEALSECVHRNACDRVAVKP